MLLLLFALSGDVEAHLSATIEANRTIAVELAYELTLDGAPPANGELVFSLLEMDEARIENLRVGQDRRPLRLDRSGGPSSRRPYQSGLERRSSPSTTKRSEQRSRSWFRASLPLRRAPGRSRPSCRFLRAHISWRAFRPAQKELPRAATHSSFQSFPLSSDSTWRIARRFYPFRS